MRPCYGPLFPAPSAARASRARNKGTVTWAQEVIGEKLFFSRSRDQCAANWCTNFDCSLGLGFRDGLGLWLSSGHLLALTRALQLRARPARPPEVAEKAYLAASQPRAQRA